MDIIDQHIQTVKDQIDYFDYRLNKEPKKTATQAKFWPLKYRFEQLLEYLFSKKESSQKINLSAPLSCFKENLVSNPQKQDVLLIPNIDQNTEKKSSQHARTIKIDDAIYKIVKDLDSGEGVPKDLIYKTLTIAQNIQITESQLSNRLWNMCNKRKILANVKKGFYAIKMS